MAYSKTNWVNNTTPINETNLNKIEQGIYDNSLVVDAITNTLNPTDTETYKTAELTEGQITDVIGVNDILIKGQTSQNGEPTPSSPVDVNVVSGSNVIKTSNKNLFNKDTVVNQSTYSGSVGQVISIATNLNTFRCPIFKKISDKITISANYTSAKMRVSLLDKDYKILSSTSYTTLPRTIDTSNCEFIAIFFDRTTIPINNNIQIEQNSTATTYELHQGKEFPLDLGSIELCKIGNYQDYFYKSGSKWYLHKEINKITSYNGETITTSYISTTGKLSTGAKVYYVVTPTDTKITDTTLISQLEAIYNAPLYEQTNITQTNNDLPMVLDITACKDNIKGIKAFIRKER